MSRLLVLAYLLEAGLLLLIAPWSVFWERNAFLSFMPAVAPLALNHFIRGAVSGIGLLCLAIVVQELWSLIARRQSSPLPSETPSPPISGQA